MPVTILLKAIGLTIEQILAHFFDFDHFQLMPDGAQMDLVADRLRGGGGKVHALVATLFTLRVSPSSSYVPVPQLITITPLRFGTFRGFSPREESSGTTGIRSPWSSRYLKIRSVRRSATVSGTFCHLLYSRMNGLRYPFTLTLISLGMSAISDITLLSTRFARAESRALSGVNFTTNRGVVTQTEINALRVPHMLSVPAAPVPFVMAIT
jgi:hypothetical protein